MKTMNFIAGCLVAGLTTIASAAEPVRLSADDMDRVVAGNGGYGGFAIADFGFGLASTSDVSAVIREDATLSSLATRTNVDGRITTRVNTRAAQTGSFSARSTGATSAVMTGFVGSNAFLF